ncbi:segregation/condensation protein A [bacterium]|nr:segregation/condensation protein A [bacterium]
MYEIHTTGFEGPLDLLVDLARKHEVDILHIRILGIINGFVDYVESVKDMEIQLTADFLSMASYLVLLKTRLMLPKTEEEEEEAMSEVSDLLDVIKKYELIKEASTELVEYRDLQDKIHFRFSQNLEGYIDSSNLSMDEMDPYVLTKIVIDFLERSSGEEAFARIARDKFNIEDKLMELFEYFKKREYAEFSEMVEGEEKSELVTAFFALLILIKRQLLTFTQKENFANIYLHSQIGDDSVLDMEVVSDEL